MARRKIISEKEKKELVEHLKCIALADIGDFVEWQDGQIRVKDSAELGDKERKAVAGIKNVAQGLEVKLWDKQKAIDQLTKMMELDSAGEASVSISVIGDRLDERKGGEENGRAGGE